MKLTGIDALSGPSQTECIPVTARHVARVIAVTVSPHRHDGPGAAKVVLVVDGDNGSFSLTVFLEGAEPHIIFSRFATGGWHSDQDHVHLKTPVGVELLIGVELPGQGV